MGGQESERKNDVKEQKDLPKVGPARGTSLLALKQRASPWEGAGAPLDRVSAARACWRGVLLTSTRCPQSTLSPKLSVPKLAVPKSCCPQIISFPNPAVLESCHHQILLSPKHAACCQWDLDPPQGFPCPVVRLCPALPPSSYHEESGQWSEP